MDTWTAPMRRAPRGSEELRGDDVPRDVRRLDLLGRVVGQSLGTTPPTGVEAADDRLLPDTASYAVTSYAVTSYAVTCCVATTAALAAVAVGRRRRTGER